MTSRFLAIKIEYLLDWTPRTCYLDAIATNLFFLYHEAKRTINYSLKMDQLMHRIGELQDHEAVAELGESLTKKGIRYYVSQAMDENHNKVYTVIIENPEDVEEATSVFNTLTGIPPSFEIPPEYEKIRSIKTPPITKNFIIACILLYIFSLFPLGKELVELLSLSSKPKQFLSEIQDGQIWRLFTPMLLHFSIPHILFNMIMFKEFGKVIEFSKGPSFFIYFIITTGTLSNIAQYMITGPFFGGMSGVIYAFFGFLWMQKVLNPDSEFSLPMGDLILIIGWFFLCLFGVIGRIANTAHAVGLVSGMLTGIFWGLKDSSEGNKSYKNAVLYATLSFFLLGLTLFVEFHRFKRSFYFFNFF